MNSYQKNRQNENYLQNNRKEPQVNQLYFK